jgi:hypothetical protein
LLVEGIEVSAHERSDFAGDARAQAFREFVLNLSLKYAEVSGLVGSRRSLGSIEHHPLDSCGRLFFETGSVAAQPKGNRLASVEF